MYFLTVHQQETEFWKLFPDFCLRGEQRPILDTPPTECDPMVLKYYNRFNDTYRTHSD